MASLVVSELAFIARPKDVDRDEARTWKVGWGQNTRLADATPKRLQVSWLGRLDLTPEMQRSPTPASEDHAIEILAVVAVNNVCGPAPFF
jgi:hypothetical protein